MVSFFGAHWVSLTSIVWRSELVSVGNRHVRDVECQAAWEQVDLVFQKAVSSLEGSCSCQPSENWAAPWERGT